MNLGKNPFLVLLRCTFTMQHNKDIQHKSVVKSMHKRRWLHLLVNSQYCKLLMHSKRQFRDKFLTNALSMVNVMFSVTQIIFLTVGQFLISCVM